MINRNAKVTKEIVIIETPKYSDKDLIKKLWIDVASRTAGSSNTVKESSAGRFASKAVDDFKKRFGIRED